MKLPIVIRNEKDLNEWDELVNKVNKYENLSEQKLINELKDWRSKAIENSDAKLMKKLTKRSRDWRYWMFMLIYLPLLVGFAIYFPYYVSQLSTDTVTIINNTHTIQESVGNYSWTYYNKTVVEHVIKGELTMTCVSQPNSSWVSCYKEVKK